MRGALILGGVLATVAMGGCAGGPQRPAPERVWVVPTAGMLGPQGSTTLTLHSELTRDEVEAVVAAGSPDEVRRPGTAILSTGQCVPIEPVLLNWVTRCGTLSVWLDSPRPGGRVTDAAFHPRGVYDEFGAINTCGEWVLPGDRVFRYGDPESELNRRLGEPRWSNGSWHSDRGNGRLARWRVPGGTSLHAELDRDRLGWFLVAIELESAGNGGTPAPSGAKRR